MRIDTPHPLLDLELRRIGLQADLHKDVGDRGVEGFVHYVASQLGSGHRRHGWPCRHGLLAEGPPS